MAYTPSEYVDMIIVYGMAGENSAEAARIYRERFPNRARFPAPLVIRDVVRRGRENGNLLPHRTMAGGGHNRIQPGREEGILDAIADDPTIGSREVESRVNVSRSAINRLTRREKIHPFHYRRVQELVNGDSIARSRFCAFLLNQQRLDPSYISRILWTDECIFTREGMFNSHNRHFYAHENPHLVVPIKTQWRWKINIWAGLTGNKLVGPFILPNRLNGESYRNFLRNELPELLEEIAPPPNQDVIFQHDGAPPHFAILTRTFLDQSYPGRWIGRGGPIAWPARSPDLNPMDFYFWSRIKEIIYKTPLVTQDECLERLHVAIARIAPEEIASVTDAVLNRANLCLENGGEHFEQFLN